MNKQEQEILINAIEHAIKDYSTAINIHNITDFNKFIYKNNMQSGLCMYFRTKNSLCISYLSNKINMNNFLFPIIYLSSQSFFMFDKIKEQCLIPRLNLLKELYNDIKNTNCHE